MELCFKTFNFALRVLALALAFLCPLSAIAANEVSPSFTLQGEFTNAAGTTAITDSNVQLTVDIYNPAANCLLYEETQTGIDLSTTSGVFGIQIGTTVGDPKRVAGQDPGLAMAAIFKNAALVRAAGAHCAGGYTSAANDGRLVRITVTSISLGTVVLAPDMVLGSVPQAVVAQTLQGLDASQFLQVSGNVTQANMATLTAGAATDASALHNHDSLYVKIGSGTSQNIGTGSFYTSGNVGIGMNAAPVNTELQVVATSAANTGILIQGAAAQAANLFEIDNSAGTPLFTVNSAGAISAGTWNGTAIGVAYGGTGLSSGTDGGIPYYSAAGTMASSAVLSQYQVVLGGGAGAAPTVVAGTGTAYQVLTSNGAGLAPTWQTGILSLSALTAAVASNTIDNTLFAQVWNWTTATTQTLLSMAANALTTGSILNLTTSSGALNSTNGLLYVANTGASTNGTVSRIQGNSTAGSGLTVLASGNVGVGTSTPTAALQVAYTNTKANGTNSGFRIAPTYNQVASTAANTDLLINRTETSVGSGNQYLIEGRVGGVTRFYVKNDGSIASGNPLPTVSNQSFSVGNANTATGTNSTAFGYHTSATGDRSFAHGYIATASGTNATAIGDHVTAAAFDSFVLGAYNVGGGSATTWVATDPLFEIGNGSAGTPANALTVLKNGNVGIATATPSYTLHVVGTAGLSTGTAWTNASDIRLKDIRGDYEYGLEEVAKLHTVRFTYKKDNPLHLPSDHPMTGFIAQEVQEIIPDAVHKNDNGYLELNADPIHWAVVNSIKQLYTKILDLITGQAERKQTVAQLKKENQELKSYLCMRFPSESFCR